MYLNPFISPSLHSAIMNLQCDSASHTVNLSVHVSLLASVHCQESLVW